ncbi:MAG: TonB-dependent receptor plug domain-containing protein [Verrucomicrobia bacterium]|nr:TonB-dependent receptor plug domain-containing protein [Verrucomicrobiota bacterium]
MKSHPLRVLALASAFAALSRAQTAPISATPATSSPPPASTPVVELSPFEVNTSKDLGYLAENTLAGSRINSRLRDTAGSVSVFTKEFLDDLAITDLSRLLDYTVNSELDTNAWQAGSGQNPMITGENLLNRTAVRGLAASQGMDYFTSITNMDPYRVGRFDDTRGPNSILFGVGAPGGLINQTSKTAVLYRDSATLRYGFGSWDQNRAEFDANKVLKKDRLAIAAAGLNQASGGWRQFDFQDKRRGFASVVARPVRTLTVTAMGELGRDRGAVVKTFPPTDEVLAWYDNRAARGESAVTVTPTTAAPTAAMIALGITTRNGTTGGQNHRATFIENNGTIFDAIGTYLTGSYGNAAVRAPDGTPGRTGSALIINDPQVFPRSANAGGPGSFREQRLYNYTFSADWQPLRALVLNLATNYQATSLTTRTLVGNEPTLRGEPNRTLGLNGPANPYAGRLYVDGNWRGDLHDGTYRETRLSATYSLEPRRTWLGRHRLAASASTAAQSDVNALAWLSLVGSPFNALASAQNNRVSARYYFTEGDTGTYRAGDWRTLPAKFTFAGRTYDLAFANDAAGANNSGMQQDTDSLVGVVQSHFWRDRLVTTAGYRQDKVSVTQFGYSVDPVVGDKVDRDPRKATVTHVKASTQSIGGVWHVTDWLSLIANRSSNVGVPPLARTVFPLGNLAPLSHGKGSDYGLGLDLLEGRVSARFVYFDGREKGRITSTGLGGAPARNSRVMDAFATVLAGTGRPLTAADWAEIYKTYTPPANAIASDFVTEGYEARLTANLTRNWRLVFNYSYTDSGRTNFATEMTDWYGLKPAADGFHVLAGVRQDATGRYVVDPNAFTSGSAIAKWIQLGSLAPGANLSTLTTDAAGTTIAQEIFNLIDTTNADRDEQQKRWGLRPHKISFFTAYDLKEGRLRGLTFGGGWRWRSANVIGSDSQRREISGREIAAADAMLAYSFKPSRLPGRVRLQINVSNLLNQTQIIPVRLSLSAANPDGFLLPGGRGVAYSRYDLVAPRETRFTTTWSF